MDSRFRGNDEELVGPSDFFARFFAGMTKYYSTVIVLYNADTSETPPPR